MVVTLLAGAFLLCETMGGIQNYSDCVFTSFGGIFLVYCHVAEAGRVGNAVARFVAATLVSQPREILLTSQAGTSPLDQKAHYTCPDLIFPRA